MQLYSHLSHISFRAHEKQFMSATAFVQCDPSTPKGSNASGATVARRRAAMENTQRALERVQSLEQQLGVAERWSRSHPDYSRAAELVRRRRYQRCLDELEGLVVARIFELSKMNMSQTGEPLYLSRILRDIYKALQATSFANTLRAPFSLGHRQSRPL